MIIIHKPDQTTMNVSSSHFDSVPCEIHVNDALISIIFDCTDNSLLITDNRVYVQFRELLREFIKLHLVIENEKLKVDPMFRLKHNYRSFTSFRNLSL